MERKCLLLCFVSLLLFPLATASGNLTLTSEDLPLNTEDNLPLNRVDLPVLNTINDLRNVDFGHTFPRHGLSLLHYIAHFLQVDNNNNIWADFNPRRNDFGFHEYRNYENIFPPIFNQNSGAYYSLGNISPGSSGNLSLPPYVTWASYQTNNLNRNRDRIVVQLNAFTHQVQDIYITQHIYNSNQYDPSQTYRISVNLLREIQLLLINVPFNYNAFLTLAGYVWPFFSDNNNCFIGGMRKLVLEDTSSDNPLSALEPARQKQCADIKLQVRTTYNGYARMRWVNIPSNLLDVGTKLELYKDTYVLKSIPIEEHSYGFYDTNQYLNPGLQVRLVTKADIIISQSPKLDDAYWSLPTKIAQYEASLQLCTRGGWASARLYIKKSFTNWKDTFYYSWVGFYNSDKEGHKQYFTYQWATRFTFRSFNSDYDVYEYQSDMNMSPGAQARFFLTKSLDNLAVTVPWESENF